MVSTGHLEKSGNKWIWWNLVYFNKSLHHDYFNNVQKQIFVMKKYSSNSNMSFHVIKNNTELSSCDSDQTFKMLVTILRGSTDQRCFYSLPLTRLWHHLNTDVPGNLLFIPGLLSNLRVISFPKSSTPPSSPLHKSPLKIPVLLSIPARQTTPPGNHLSCYVDLSNAPWLPSDSPPFFFWKAAQDESTERESGRQVGPVVSKFHWWAWDECISNEYKINDSLKN